MKTYRLRFEAPIELVQFIRDMGDKIFNYYVVEGTFDFVFSSGMHYRDILDIISNIPDAHIMYETIAYEDEYDNERKDWKERCWDGENDDLSDEIKTQIPHPNIDKYFNVH